MSFTYSVGDALKNYREGRERLWPENGMGKSCSVWLPFLFLTDRFLFCWIKTKMGYYYPS
jgi:hypothetical protein